MHFEAGRRYRINHRRGGYQVINVLHVGDGWLQVRQDYGAEYVLRLSLITMALEEGQVRDYPQPIDVT